MKDTLWVGEAEMMGSNKVPCWTLLTPNFHFSESLAASVTCFTQRSVVLLESSLSGWKLVQRRGKKTSLKLELMRKITLPQEAVERSDSASDGTVTIFGS